MHIFKYLTTFLWVTTERSINRFGPKKTGFFRSGCRLPVNLKSRQPPGCGCAENLAEKPDRIGLLNTSHNGCLSTNLVVNAKFPSTVSEVSNTIPLTLNQYVTNFLHYTSQNLSLRVMHSMTCAQCNMCLTTSLAFVNSPPVLFLEVPMKAGSSLSGILPSWHIEVPSPSYTSSKKCYWLTGVIYFGSFHFTSRLISENDSVWKYDGQSNNGVPIFEFTTLRSDSELLHFLTLDSRKAHIYVYCITVTGG